MAAVARLLPLGLRLAGHGRQLEVVADAVAGGEAVVQEHALDHVFCNVAGHFAAGMWTEFEVTK